MVVATGNENDLDNHVQDVGSSSDEPPPLPQDVFSAPKSSSAPKSVPVITCGVTARKFVSKLNAQQPVTVKCESSCLNVDETKPGWQVYGYGPFRDDSSICKAAFVAGVIGNGGGVATLLFAGRAGVIGNGGGVATLLFAGRVRFDNS